MVKVAVLAALQVISLQIVKPLPQYLKGVAYVGQPGTTVTFALERKGKFIIGLDEKACTLGGFGDDKGTVLAKPGPGGGFRGWLGSFPKVSADGWHVIFQVHSESVPAAGAKELKIQAEIALFCGSDEKTEHRKDVPLKQGATLTEVPFPIKIAGVRETSMGEAKVSVKLTGSKSFDSIKEFVFLGADGKEIKYDCRGSGRWGSGGHMTYSRTFALHKKVDMVTVRITYYARTETVTVPIDASISVGL